jgi:hypothetical protein
VVLIRQKGEHFMPTMRRPVSVISLKGAKAWCQTHHPLKMILNTVEATWGMQTWVLRTSMLDPHPPTPGGVHIHTFRVSFGTRTRSQPHGILCCIQHAVHTAYSLPLCAHITMTSPGFPCSDTLYTFPPLPQRSYF